MMLEGGLRDRMLVESITNQVVAHLTLLGWFNAGRQHLPITVTDEYPGDDDEVALNTLAFSWEQAEGEDAELGSLAEEHETVLFIDFFAQNDAVGRELIGDVYAFLKKNRVLPVYDYRQDPAVVDFYVDIEDVSRRKPERATNAWQKHWYVCSLVARELRANA